MKKIYRLSFSISILLAGMSAYALQSDSACPDGVCTGLGEGFFLPNINTQTSIVSGAQLLDAPIRLGECAYSVAKTEAYDAFDKKEGMSQLISKLATDSNVSGGGTIGAYTMKASVEVQTGTSSDSTKSFTSVIYDRKLLDGVVELKNSEDCFSVRKLSNDFIQHFESLPARLAKPGEFVNNQDAWAEYISFLERFGSHYLNQLEYGSRFQIWESTDQSSSETANLLKVKACMSVEAGSAQAGSNIAACSSVTSEDISKAKNLSSTNKKVIRGGTNEARKNLVNSATKANMDAFIQTAGKATQAINWHYKPIWETLKSEYGLACERSGSTSSRDCQDYQRAINLQAAYEGVAAWGCEYRKSGNVVLGGMKLGSITNSRTGAAQWSCVQAKTGCVDDDSCHWHTGTVSHCWGNLCFDQKQIPGTNQYLTVVKADYDENVRYFHGVNNSCKIGGAIWTEAYCIKDWKGGLPERAIWRQSTAVKSSNSSAVSVTSQSTDDGVDSVGYLDNGLKESYKVSVSFTNQKIRNSDVINMIDPVDSTSSNESTDQVHNPGFVVLSNPRGINCPGASCTSEFATGEKVMLGFIDSDSSEKLTETNGSRCIGTSRKVRLAKVIEELQISDNELSDVIRNAEFATLCEFVVNEDIDIDFNLKSKGNKE